MPWTEIFLTIDWFILTLHQLLQLTKALTVDDVPLAVQNKTAAKSSPETTCKKLCSMMVSVMKQIENESKSS